jgi:hypothetical protein
MKRLPKALPQPTTHIIDWFHIAMKIQPLQQIADHIVRCRDAGNSETAHVDAEVRSLKWKLWHGQTDRALDQLETMTSDLAKLRERGNLSGNLRWRPRLGGFLAERFGGPLPREELGEFVCGVSAMRARTSASQACGSTSLSFAVWTSVYMTAARSAPRSDPANSHDFLPSARPRSARSAALLEKQMRPSSRTRVGTVTRSVALLGSTGKMAYDLVCAPSVPPCDHPARCLALYSLHTQLSRC